MNLGLDGKTAIVMAASKGLGKAVAAALVMEGANVVIGARNEKTLAETAKEIGAFAVPADVNKPKDLEGIVAETIKKFGRIDILVNNAGGPPPGTFEEVADKQWQQTFETNLMSAVRLIRLVLPYMKKTGSGRIINMVSTSVKQPIENLLLSNAIRTGVIGMAKTLSQELAVYNITVNNVAPGRFLTDRIKQIYKNLEDAVTDIPMKRIGKPEEFGALVAFLASEQAAYITGTTIQIDGGLVRSIL